MSVAAARPAHAGSPSPSTAPLKQQWPRLRAVWKAMPVGAFSTVGPDGAPQIAPIGSVFLHPTEPRGYYHPVFTSRLQRSLQSGGRFELLFLDLRLSTWLPALIRGEFRNFVATRLQGCAAGPRRAATEGEVSRWHRQVRAVRWTRGHDLLWANARHVQELTFDGYVPVRFGAMPHG